MAPQSSAFRLLLFGAAATLLVAVLALAQAVIVPLALAAMLGFVLIPPVAALERFGLHRTLSIALVLSVALGVVAGFGYVIARQFSDFATHMPEYSASIKTKLATLRETRQGAIGKIEETVEKVSRELDKQEAAQRRAPDDPPAFRRDVQPVSIVGDRPNEIERLRAMLEPVLRPVATAGIVLILVIFVLAQREDIRNRLLRLAGGGRLTVTTRTMDEAGQRISKFLFSQSIINAIFGVVVAGGLLVIGVPYALLWGVTAAVLRFVPYLGSLLAMLMPGALAFVVADGWTPVIETLALFLVMDGVTAYLVEPILIGTRTGISSLALLISAMFWTWLWGPVGLLLSTPIAVCLTTIGKHVNELEFLAILLGDEPALAPEVTLYQRLLAGDEDETKAILDGELEKEARTDVFDHLIAPTLRRADLDRMRGDISAAEHLFVVDTLREMLQNHTEPHSPDDANAPDDRRPGILGVPARSASDQLGLEIVGQLVGGRWDLTPMSTTTLVSEVLLAMEEALPDLVCVVALPPGGLSHARYLAKRIHARFPDVPFCLLRAGAHPDPIVERPLAGAGVEHVVYSFTELVTYLQWLEQHRRKRSTAAPCSEPRPAA